MTDPISAVGAADKAVLEALAQMAANAALQLASQAPDTAATHAHDIANQALNASEQAGPTNAEQRGPQANWHESVSNGAQNLQQLAQAASSQSAQSTVSTANADGLNQSLAQLNGGQQVVAMRSPETQLVPVLVSTLQVPIDNRVRQQAVTPAPDRQRSYERLRREQECEGAESEQNDDQHNDESDGRNAPAAKADIALDANSRRTAVVERSDPLYVRILAALRQDTRPASQACLLELQRGRKTLVALPCDDAPGLHSSALACLLWRDQDAGRAACFDARLIWTSARRAAAWIGVRTHKDCDGRGQRILKTLPGSGSETSGVVFLSAEQLSQIRWRDAALVVGEAARLWAMLGHQWSVRVAISTVPLDTWQEQTQ